MHHLTRRALYTTAAVIFLAAVAGPSAAAAATNPKFGPDSAQITNPYLPISESRRCVLRGPDEGRQQRIVRVLLGRTKTFRFRGRRVEAAVVRDSVTDVKASRLVERTLDYFAQDRRGGVHYLGEKVDEFTPGGAVHHGGAWLLGRDAKRPGLLMPAHPRLGDKFRSEKATGIAVETDKITTVGGRRRIGGTTYSGVIRIREHATTPAPADFEFKEYARGVGVISEANGGVKLVGCT